MYVKKKKISILDQVIFLQNLKNIIIFFALNLIWKNQGIIYWKHHPSLPPGTKNKIKDLRMSISLKYSVKKLTVEI